MTCQNGASARLEAKDPLLRAGLERAARAASLRIAQPGEPAALAVRTAGAGLPHQELDVVYEPERTVVTVTGQPSDDAWLAVLCMIRQLVADP